MMSRGVSGYAGISRWGWKGVEAHAHHFPPVQIIATVSEASKTRWFDASFSTLLAVLSVFLIDTIESLV
jgi:hypothetical protein